jgi:Cdc6-like AAA superfamily ATPase
MYAHQKDNKLRHYLRDKALKVQQLHPKKPIDYSRVAEVIPIFDITKMHAMLIDHEKRSNLYRNHQRYINFLGDTSGFLPLVTLPTDILARLEDLRLRFPNFSAAIDFYREQFALAQLAENAVFSANPLLLSGPAGVGKTAFCHELAKIVATPFELIGLSSTTAGFVLSGMSSNWADGKPGKVVETLARERRGNPLIVVDEIDKIGGDNRYDPFGALYQLLEIETASHFIDEGLEVGTNCAHIVWVGTANNLSKIPVPILSRFTVIEVNSPTHEQMKNIVESIYRKVRQNYPWGKQFSEKLPVSVTNTIVESGLAPRLMQKELIAACGKAVLRRAEAQLSGNDRYEISPDDFKPRDRAKPRVAVTLRCVLTKTSSAHNAEEEVLIVRWSVKEIRCRDASETTQHLIGYIPDQGIGRVTTAIQSFDRATMRLKTDSGHIYHLVGQPGMDADAEYIWAQWKDANGVSEDIDITGQYCWVH